jgi:hypothetical protein
MANLRVAGIAAALVLAAMQGRAQTVPLPPNRPAAAAADAQRLAFLAMPEADRKAIQDALGWLGLYNGAVDGGFGKRTLDAICAYQNSVKAPADGLVTAAQLAALKQAAQKARAAVGFQTLDDPATGLRIGAPLKLLDRKTSGSGETRLASRDDAVTLELSAPRGPLSDLYDRLTAETPGRKITYKAIKADAFFAVAGEEAGRKFYQRYARAPTSPDTLRGFVFAYPLARAAALDPVALAVANAFEPFPDALPDAPPPPPPASAPTLTATALVVAPGQALTALRESDCRDPTIAGKPARFLRADASGLALLGGDFGAGAAPPRGGVEDKDLMVLSLSPGAPGKTVLEAADASASGAADGAVVASLAASARGAPVLDRRGGLAAIVAPMPSAPKHLAGVTLAEPHQVIAEAKLASFVALGEPDPGGQPLRAADLAREMRGAIVGVFCAP